MSNKLFNEIIQKGLNDQINGEKYMGQDITFYVHKNEGDFKAKTGRTQRSKGKFIVNGMLLDESSIPVAVQGLNAFEKKQTLEIAVPVDMTAADVENEIYTGGIDYALQVVEAFTRANTGAQGKITLGDIEYFYVLSVSLPYVGEESFYAGIGKCIAVSVELTWQLFEGVIGNELVVQISVHNANDYTTAILIDGSAVRERSGDTSQYDNKANLEMSITQQSLTVQVAIPYKRSGVALSLIQDLWSTDVSSLNKLYDIKYYDNVAFEEAHPFEGVFTAQEIKEPLKVGAALSITATFALAHIEE